MARWCYCTVWDHCKREMRLSDVLPRSTIDDSRDIAEFHAELSSKDSHEFSGQTPLADFTNIRLGQSPHRVSFTILVDVCRMVIFAVFGSCTPTKILQSVVSFYPVQVATFRAIGTWSRKRFQDQTMDAKCAICGSIGRGKVDSGITVRCQGQLHVPVVAGQFPSRSTCDPGNQNGSIRTNSISRESCDFTIFGHHSPSVYHHYNTRRLLCSRCF